MKYSAEIQARFTNQMLAEFAAGLDEVLRARLGKIAGRVPAQTLANMRYKIMEASAADISARYELWLQDSGRISEMRNIKGGKGAPVEQILDWIKRGRRGLFKSRDSSGRRGGQASERELEGIAFVIAKKKKKALARRGRKLKERQWLNTNLYSWYNRLIEDFIRRQPELLNQMVKEAFEPLAKIDL